jgi:tetratricopeptide (TPR) repeat protein/transcriptional regulator with XRE-family HTH domain
MFERCTLCLPRERSADFESAAVQQPKPGLTGNREQIQNAGFFGAHTIKPRRDQGDNASVPAAAALALMLRRLRKERGLSMREMARPLNLAAHSAVADFESGRRLPAADILAAYERHFGLSSGSLLALRQKALAERAGEEARLASLELRAAALDSAAPAQLPHDDSAFVGRESQLHRLHQAIAGQQAAHRAATFVICSIDGIAGVGKSALVMHFAHQIADRFPDGQLYLDLRGHDPRGAPLTPGQALGQLMRTLGADPGRLTVDTAELAAHYRTATAGRRLLIVLDNAADTGQVRPLLPGNDGCLVLVTSRRHLPGIVARDGAERMVLGPLSPDEAMDLLVRVVGTVRVAREPEAAAQIARLCGYLPLALRIAAEQATAHAEAPLADVASRLADERTLLASLAVEDDETTGVRAAFSWSYRELPARQARFFRLLARHPGPTFTAPAAAALAGTGQEEAGVLLAALTAAHLVEPIDDARYRLHDLLRAYGLECFAAAEPPEADRAAVERVASWYLHTAAAAAWQVRPARRHVPPPSAPPGVTPLTFPGYDEGLAWLDAECRNCVAAADAAQQHELDEVARAFPGALYDVFELRGRFEEWNHAIDTALVSARRLGDLMTQAALLTSLAIARARTARYHDALSLLRQSLELRRRTQDRRGEAATLGNIGNILNEFDRPEEALPYFLEAAAIQAEVGDRLGEAMSLGNLGLTYQRQGRHVDTIAVCERALELFLAIEDRPGTARTLSNLAEAHARLRNAEAVAYGLRALEAGRACGARDIEALALRDLGQALRDRGELDRAQEHLRRSLAIFEELGDGAAAQVRALLDACDR